MKGRIRLVEGMRFLASTDSNHGIIFDAGSDGGGTVGPSPMEAVLLAAGCCTAMDVVYILKRMRQPLDGLEVVVEAERAEEDPRVFTSMTIHYKVKGKDLKADSVERAINLSLERYCSVTNMLREGAVKVSSEFDISG